MARLTQTRTAHARALGKIISKQIWHKYDFQARSVKDGHLGVPLSWIGNLWLLGPNTSRARVPEFGCKGSPCVYQQACPLLPVKHETHENACNDDQGFVNCSATLWPLHILSSSRFTLKSLSHRLFTYVTKISTAHHQKASAGF
jgi:hypothetical protein